MRYKIFLIACLFLTLIDATLASSFIFTRSLSRGVSGDEVRQLQLFLKQFPEIYPEGLVTGYFGSLTEKAVKRFQIKNSLPSVGLVGPLTRLKINFISSQSTSILSEQAPISRSFGSNSSPANTSSLNNIIAATTTPTNMNIATTTIINLNTNISTNASPISTIAPTYQNPISNSTTPNNQSNNAVIEIPRTPPHITSISSISGLVGSTILITGTGFNIGGNDIHFDAGGTANVKSIDGKTLNFTIPSSVHSCYWLPLNSVCNESVKSINPGNTHPIFVINSNGVSNAITFNVAQLPPIAVISTTPASADITNNDTVSGNTTVSTSESVNQINSTVLNITNQIEDSNPVEVLNSGSNSSSSVSSNTISSEPVQNPVVVTPSKPNLHTEAEAALQKGAVLIDSEGDWELINDGNPRPSSAYAVAAADLRSIALGSDDTYLYLKFKTSGSWPKYISDLPIFSGDPLNGVAFNGWLYKTSNCTSITGGGDAVLNFGARNENGGILVLEGYGVGATGIDQPETERYFKRYDFNTWWEGGPGYDYTIFAYPFLNLGFQKGQTISLRGWLEAGSILYHHPTFDSTSCFSFTL